MMLKCIECGQTSQLIINSLSKQGLGWMKNITSYTCNECLSNTKGLMKQNDKDTLQS